MWFRNFRTYSTPGAWTLSAAELEERLAQDAFAPCAPGQVESLGWEPPLGEEDAPLVVEIGGHQLLRARLQQRILPASAVREVLEERIASAAEAKGAPLRAAEKRELAEDVRGELMPRALLRSQRFWLLIDRQRGLLLPETAAAARAEALLSLLRGSLGNLAVTPAAFGRPVADSLTLWLRSGDTPAGFELGHWCDLEDPQDTANKVRFRGQPLDEDDVQAALARGLNTTALELTWDAGSDATMSFVIDAEGALRRVRYPEAEPDAGDDESAAARLHAELALLGPTLDNLLAALHPALGGLADG